MLDEDKKDDPSQIARWGTDEERREFRRGVEGSLAARLTMRRQAADARGCSG
jgi:hypothetical protein